jgi:hypothetical protein
MRNWIVRALLAVYMGLVAALVVFVLTGVQPVDSKAHEPRNQWGQRGPAGCETILQWTERCPK